MTRHSLLAVGLVGLLALSGCSILESQRFPTPRRGGTVYQPAPRSADYRRDNRRDARGTAEWRRVRRDVRAYVDLLDRELRLDNRQERRIRETLEDRTYRLLDRADRREVRRIYPFPRRLNARRYANRQVERFWNDADKRVERSLDRDQRREYEYLTGQRRDRDRRADRRDDRKKDRKDKRRNRRGRRN